jgi:hypothetical protein
MMRGLHLDGIWLHLPFLNLDDKPSQFFKLHHHPQRCQK